jgi:CRP-like cAMP-binding protein
LTLLTIGELDAEEEVRTLSRGDYFGEQALLKEESRTANVIALSPGVECLTLDREFVPYNNKFVLLPYHNMISSSF